VTLNPVFVRSSVNAILFSAEIQSTSQSSILSWHRPLKKEEKVKINFGKSEAFYRQFKKSFGLAVTQAVRRWLPTTPVRVRVLAACVVCGGQSGTGAGFLQVLRFPLPIIPPISPSS
jgi:hypothetical protein